MQSTNVDPAADAASAERYVPLVWSRVLAGQPWVLISAMLLFLVTCAVVLFGSFLVASLEETAAPPILGHIVIGMATFMSCLYLIPAVLLYRYWAQVRRAAQTRLISQLMKAYRTKTRFWRYSAAVFIAYVLLSIVMRVINRLVPELML